MIRYLALSFVVLFLPLHAHAQFKLPNVDFTKPPSERGAPPMERLPGIPMRIYEVPEDVRVFIGKEETCANYIKLRRSFTDNPEVMNDLNYSFSTIECNQLPCERYPLVEKYRNERDVLQFIYTYTDGSVPAWTEGGTGKYYADNVCVTPLDPNKPPPMNPYSPDFVKRMDDLQNPEIVESSDLTEAQIAEVMSRIDKLDLDKITDEQVNKIVDDVKAGR